MLDGGVSVTQGLEKILIKTLSTKQLQWCLVIQVHIVKWVSQNLGHPNQTGLGIFDEAQVDRTEQQARHAQTQPRIAYRMHEFNHVVVSRNDIKLPWKIINDQGQKNPNTEQHHFTLKVVTHLDFFFVLVGRMVDVVIAQRFKKKCPD